MVGELGRIKFDKLERISGYYYNVYYTDIDNGVTGKDIIVIKKADGVSIGNDIFVNNINKGINITAKKLENVSLKNEAINRGYTNVIASYELTLEGATELSNPIDITFNIGSEYNNKNIYVLHQKNNGNYEEFEEVAKNGKITITVNELSPFVLAIKDETDDNSQVDNTDNVPNVNEEGISNKLDETPKTGEYDTITVICLTAIVLSVAGIAIIKKYIK